MDLWHVSFDSVECGPVSEHALRAWAMQGRVKPDDMIRRHDHGNWVKARDAFPHWFSQAVPMPLAPLAMSPVGPVLGERTAALPPPATLPLSPERPSLMSRIWSPRGASLILGFTGAIVMPVLAMVVLWFVVTNKTPGYGWEPGTFAKLVVCSKLLNVGLSLSIVACIVALVGLWYTRPVRAGLPQSHDNRGRTASGLILGCFGVALNLFCFVVIGLSVRDRFAV